MTLTISERDILRLERQIQEVQHKLDTLDSQVSEIHVLVNQQGATCPYRDDIVRARNNILRFNDLEQRIRTLEIAMARSGTVGGLAGGGIVGVITMILFGIGKLFGWW